MKLNRRKGTRRGSDGTPAPCHRHAGGPQQARRRAVSGGVRGSTCLLSPPTTAAASQGTRLVNSCYKYSLVEVMFIGGGREPPASCRGPAPVDASPCTRAASRSRPPSRPPCRPPAFPCRTMSRPHQSPSYHSVIGHDHQGPRLKSDPLRGNYPLTC